MGSLVFAYGSNLDADQMAARCPAADLIDVAVLHDFRLVFSGHSPAWGGGVANVLRCPGDSVAGALWRLGPLDLARLDAYEGHPATYVRTTVQVENGGGSRIRAQVYIKTKREVAADPSASYLHRILGGYIALGMDAAPLLRAVADTHYATRAARHEAIVDAARTMVGMVRKGASEKRMKDAIRGVMRAVDDFDNGEEASL